MEHVACFAKGRRKEGNGVPQTAPTRFGLAAISRIRPSRMREVPRSKTRSPFLKNILRLWKVHFGCQLGQEGANIRT